MNSDDENRVSRRRFLHSLGLVGMAGASGSVLAACGDSEDSQKGSGTPGTESSGSSAASGPCSDLSSLSSKEKEKRKQLVESLQYVEKSPQEKKTCSNCQLYTKSEYAEGCGGCSLFPGPVNAKGYCNSWAPVV